MYTQKSICFPSVLTSHRAAFKRVGGGGGGANVFSHRISRAVDIFEEMWDNVVRCSTVLYAHNFSSPPSLSLSYGRGDGYPYCLKTNTSSFFRPP